MNKDKKEEYRCYYAGNAMHSIVNAIWANSKTQDEVIESAKRLGFKSVYDFVAAESVKYADSLINELEQEK